MAKEEYEMPQSESDVGSESGEVDRKSDKSDNESEYDDDGNDGDDNEDDDDYETLWKRDWSHCILNEVSKMFVERFLLEQRCSMYDM